MKRWLLIGVCFLVGFLIAFGDFEYLWNLYHQHTSHTIIHKTVVHKHVTNLVSAATTHSQAEPSKHPEGSGTSSHPPTTSGGSGGGGSGGGSGGGGTGNPTPPIIKITPPLPLPTSVCLPGIVNCHG